MLLSQAPIMETYSIPNRILTTQDGLISNFVYGAVQDHEGYMWFYTDKGISKYDGHQFKNFTMADGLPSQNVWMLTVDNQNRIWVHTHDNVLSYIHNDTIHKVITYSKELQPTVLYQKGKDSFILEAKTGDYLLYKDDNVFKLEQIYLNQKNIINNVQGQVYFKYLESLYYMISQYTTKCSILDHNNNIINEFKLNNNNIFYTPQKINNNILFTHQKGFYLLLDGKIKSEVTIKNEQLLNRSIYDNNGNIWTGTLNQGLFFYIKNNNKILKVPFENNNQINNAFLINNKLYLYDSKNNLLTLGHNYNLQYEVNLPEIREIHPFFENKVLINWQFNTRVYSTKQKLSTTFAELYKVNLKYFLPASLRKSIILSDSKLIAMCLNNTVNIIETRNTSNITTTFHHDSFRIADIYLDSKKRTHVFSKEKIFIYDQNYCFDTSYSLVYNGSYLVTKCAIEDINNGRSIIGTPGNGIYTTDSNFNWYMIPNTEKLDVNSLAFCNGFLAAYCNQGIFLIQTNNAPYTISNVYGRGSGLNPEDILEMYVDSAYLYAVCRRFIAKINPECEKELQREIHISTVQTNNNKLTITDLKNLPPNCENIKIVFSILDYARSDDIKYFYKLKDEDPWIGLNINEILLDKLNSGKYNLSISARNKYSNLVYAESKYPIIVKEYWYKSIWFILFANSILFSILFLIYQQWTKRRQKLRDKLSQLELGLKEVKLQALEGQMNPHFIFNSLTAIQYFIQQKEFEDAEYFLTQFSKLIRQYLEAARSSTISLTDEIKLISRYIELEYMRFENKFEYNISVDEAINTDEVYIPTMLIQPFIENALRHGLFHRPENGALQIVIAEESNKLKIQILDNGIGIDEAKQITNHASKDKISLALQIFKEKVEVYNNIGAYFIDYSFENLNLHEKKYKGTKIEIIISQTGKV